MLRIEPKIVEAKRGPRGARPGGTTSATDFSALISERRPIRMSGARQSAPIEGLLALQSGDDSVSPAVRRRAAKGMALLDTLEDLRLDTLSGRAPEETLDHLAGQLQALGHPTHSRGLERVMQALELRVRVELAKREVARDTDG